ncbi:hypothetical protein VNO78_11124 [Psophocarpus tetragonolobus]|uniref:Uncharacterized protein n=1 Tax=Psophocarpus tetragonolobus TaxID=3891 RepID=A0AAN9SL71_PSOTE
MKEPATGGAGNCHKALSFSKDFRSIQHKLPLKLKEKEAKTWKRGGDGSERVQSNSNPSDDMVKQSSKACTIRIVYRPRTAAGHIQVSSAIGSQELEIPGKSNISDDLALSDTKEDSAEIAVILLCKYMRKLHIY